VTEYRALGERNKSHDEGAMAQAAQCLAHPGLTAHDIASTLNLHTTAVHRMLTPACAERATTNRQSNKG
jgi:DNA-binding transcriptional regulator LsrR (DeoR family)